MPDNGIAAATALKRRQASEPFSYDARAVTIQIDAGSGTVSPLA